MLPINDKCTGCGSCAAVCPKKCIKMEFDSEGFRYPKIDAAQCVHCNACEKVCPVISNLSLENEPSVFAAYNLNENVREVSSSGGVFSALAEDVISRGGAVCAAAYNEDFSVSHILVNTLEGINKLRGAKYSQSSAEHCFPQILNLLNSGISVLFVGTPCQTSGLRSYLGKDYDDLFLVDMVCHGVPSPKVWKAYLSARQKIDAPDSEITSINLRNKSTGWSNYAYSVEINYKNGVKYSVPQSQDWFMLGFTGNLYLRPSCGNCNFKGKNRCSDITLGDFWGIWETNPEFDDNKGISLLMINSDKGQNYWNRISERFNYQKMPLQDALKYNQSAVQSSVPNSKRSEFFKKFNNGENTVSLIEELLTPPFDKPSIFRRIINRLKRKG